MVESWPPCRLDQARKALDKICGKWTYFWHYIIYDLAALVHDLAVSGHLLSVTATGNEPNFKGTQSRNPYTSLSGKSAINKLSLLLCPDPARLPGTHPLAIQTSQCLLLSVYYTTTHAQ